MGLNKDSKDLLVMATGYLMRHLSRNPQAAALKINICQHRMKNGECVQFHLTIVRDPHLFEKELQATLTTHSFF